MTLTLSRSLHWQAFHVRRLHACSMTTPVSAPKCASRCCTSFANRAFIPIPWLVCWLRGGPESRGPINPLKPRAAKLRCDRMSVSGLSFLAAIGIGSRQTQGGDLSSRYPQNSDQLPLGSQRIVNPYTRKEKITMSKKVLTLVSMILVLAMLLAACGGAATPAPRPRRHPPRRPNRPRPQRTRR